MENSLAKNHLMIWANILSELNSMVSLGQENSDPFRTDRDIRTPSPVLLDMEDSGPEDSPMVEPTFVRSTSEIDRTNSTISAKFNKQ